MQKYFVIGSQKSGTTWLRDCLNYFIPFVKSEWYYVEIFQNIERHVDIYGQGLDSEKKEELINKLCLESWNILNEGIPGEKSAYPCTDLLNKYKEDLYPFVVEKIRSRIPNAKIILIVRDPRAVFNSLIHYVEYFRAGWSKELDERAFSENWAIQNSHWINDKPDSIVKYEELKKNFDFVLPRILNDIGIEFTEGDVEEAKFSVFDINKLRPKQPEIYRTGTIDEWRNKLSEETVSVISQHAGHLMNALGYNVGG